MPPAAGFLPSSAAVASWLPLTERLRLHPGRMMATWAALQQMLVKKKT